MNVRRIVRNVSGLTLIGLGIVGLFLPFLQGVVMILAGIALLDFDRKTHFLARSRRRLTRWGVPRRWMTPSRAMRARRVARAHKRANPVDVPEVVE